MSVGGREKSFEAHVARPLKFGSRNAFSGQDSDMNVQATGIASRDESHPMSVLLRYHNVAVSMDRNSCR